MTLALLLVAGCSSAPAVVPRRPDVTPAVAASAEVPRTPPPPAAVQKSAAVEKLTPERALARLFTASAVEADWMAPSFAAAVPSTKVTSIVKDVVSELGPFERVAPATGGYEVLLARGKVPAKITLDADGRIRSLWFSPAEAKARPLTAIDADLAALPGKVAYVVMTDGAVLASRDADLPLAVGSAFKLAILEGLRQKIEAKKARWSDVVKLEGKHKSLPSGSLHTWPEKAPLTLHTAASLMVSVSDNTATDLLLDYVGRDVVEKLAPGNAPFLSTREAFVLKAKANATLQARWRAADAGARRAMLPELASKPLDRDTELEEAQSVDIEWKLSPRQLCTLLAKTKVLDVTKINPGVASPKDWDVVAFKGGSEPGVLNLSTWVEKAGKAHCVVTTWNDAAKAVDDPQLIALHGALLRALR